MVSAWTGSMKRGELVGLLDSEEVPVSPINSISDIFQDPQFQARNSMIEIDDPVLGKVKMPGVVPRLSRSPGFVEALAPSLGQHNRKVYGELLGYSPEEIANLTREDII